jgi:hypothetical protein
LLTERKDTQPTGPVARPPAQAKAILVAVGVVLAALHGDVYAQQAEHSDLLKEARNPLVDLPTVEIQPNFNLHVGPHEDTEYFFNVEPLVPVQLPKDWTLFTRTTVPLLNEPGSEPDQGYTFGIGDIQEALFLSPPSSPTFMWGVGPVLQFPSASATNLGSGKWEIGPAAAAVVEYGSWELAAQAFNLWSFTGDATRPEVNQLLVEPLATFTLPGDWYLTSSPEVTANWKASVRDRWTVPVGGGIGKLFSIGRPSMTIQAEPYYNVERPREAATWSFVVTVQFMFP